MRPRVAARREQVLAVRYGTRLSLFSLMPNVLTDSRQASRSVCRAVLVVVRVASFGFGFGFGSLLT